jgi:hypothetical protein
VFVCIYSGMLYVCHDSCTYLCVCIKQQELMCLIQHQKTRMRHSKVCVYATACIIVRVHARVYVFVLVQDLYVII